ncbi:Glucan endo-1,3-beta-D-glucosidase [Platanthera zijinensis]|uniref:Glucan endo-1,3-beta-D-glucosidase n=1 Tax=Platanthera zijinensis TaxID=2320716 RepID=A0AAP0BVI9_9ASPA
MVADLEEGAVVDPREVRAAAKNTWCVANPATSEADLQNNIQFACSSTDCSLIQYGGACFDPQTIIFHASVAMNLYYQSVGRNSWNCYFGGSGLIVTTDPSYGNCKYANAEIC